MPKGRHRRDTKTETSIFPPEYGPTTFNPKQKRVIVNRHHRVTTYRPNHYISGPPNIPPPPRNLTDTVPSHDSALEDKPKSTSNSFLVKPAIYTRARLVKSHNQPQTESTIQTSAVPPDDAGGGGEKGGDRGGTNGDESGRAWNLATKVMRNGVEVIVATDKSTLPGEPEVLRVLPSSLRPITLSPSTLTDQMLLLLPSQVEQELAGAPLITRTITTAYEFPVGAGEDKVKSTSLVTNVETLGDVSAPVPETTSTVRLYASPTFDTSVYSTTYTYLTTLHNGDLPLVLTSRRTLSNTVTAAADALGPAIDRSPPSTHTLELVRGDDVVTQVLVVESDAARPIVTAPPIVEPLSDSIEPSTVEVVKTYFVTYTYYSTFAEGKSTVVRSNVAVSKDVATETFIKKPKRTSALRLETTAAPPLPLPLSPEFPIMSSADEFNTGTKAPENLPLSEKKPVVIPVTQDTPSPPIAATKTYVTTFTYFTTMVDTAASTVVSSRTRVVQNVVTENSGNDQAVLHSPAQLESVEVTTGSTEATPALPTTVTSTPNNINDKVVTGSTIIFFDDDTEADEPADSNDGDSVPAGAEEISAFSDITITSVLPTTNKKKVVTTRSSLRRHPVQSVSKSKVKNTLHNHRPASLETTALPYRTSILASRTVTPAGATLYPGEKVLVVTRPGGDGEVLVPLSDKRPSDVGSLRPAGSLGGVSSNLGGSSSGSGGVGVGDLLSLGSLGFNVFHAMAGLLSPSKSAESDSSPHLAHARPAHPVLPLPLSPPPPPPGLNTPPVPAAAVSRAPIYIPVGVLAKDSIADGSQRVHQDLVKPNGLEGVVPWVDVQQNLKPGQPVPPAFGTSLMPHRAPSSHTSESDHDHDESEPLAPGLSAGIPIQPGQVITTNSDIIIGKPSVHGPRPPKLPDEFPSGMLPPPLPQPPPPPPLPPPPPPLPLPIHEERPGGGPNIPHHHEILNPLVEQPLVIHAPSESDTILSPPPLQPDPPHYSPIGGVGPTHVSVIPQGQKVFVGRPVGQKINVDHPIIQPDTIAGPIILPGNPKVVPSGSGQHLLVNIQPSQVANVIIPHGSSTALIYSVDSLGHGKRGESADAPLPHMNNYDDEFSSSALVPRPSSAISMEVPIPAEGIQVQISAGHAAEHALGGNKHSGQGLFQQQFEEDQKKHEQHLLYHKRQQENLSIQPLKPPVPSYQLHGQESQRPHVFLQPSFQPEDEQQLQQHLLNHPGHEHEHSYYYVIQHESGKPFDKNIGGQPAPSEQGVVNKDHNAHTHQSPERESGNNERPFNRRPPKDQQHSTGGQVLSHHTPVITNEFDHQNRPSEHEVHLRPHFVKPHKPHHQAYIPLHLGHAPPKPNLPESHLHKHLIQAFPGQPHRHPDERFQQDLFNQQDTNDEKNQYIPVKLEGSHAGLVPPPPPPSPLPPPSQPHRHHGPPAGPLPSSQPLADTPVDFMRPPPVPPRIPVVIPLQPADGAADLEGGELDEPIETEGGELIQESNSRPLRPGQIPIEVAVANSKTTPHPPFRVESPVRSSLIFEQRQPPEVLGMTPPPITTLRPTRRPQSPRKPHPISLPPYKFEVPSQPSMAEPPEQRPPATSTFSPPSQPPQLATFSSEESVTITPLRHSIRSRPVPAKVDASTSATSQMLDIRPLKENQTSQLAKTSLSVDVPKRRPTPVTQRKPPITTPETLDRRPPQEYKSPPRGERPSSPLSYPLSPVTSRPPQRSQATTLSPPSLPPSPPPTLPPSPTPSPNATSPPKTTSKPYLPGLLTSSPRPQLPKRPPEVDNMEESTLMASAAAAPARPPTLPAPAIKPTPSGARRRPPSVSLVPPPPPAMLPSRPPVSILPTRYVTQTETQYITSTETTVVRTQGEKTTKTSTHTRTMLVTRTQTLTHTTTEVHTATSTATVHLVDTVTKTQTLVQTTITPSTPVSTEFSHTQITPLPASLPTASTTTSHTELEAEHSDQDHGDTDEISDGYKPTGEAYDEIITHPQHENDSIFVIVSDHHDSNKPVLPEDELSTADETNDIKDNNVLLGGVLVASPSPPHTPPHYGSPPITIGTTDNNGWSPDAAAAAAARGEVCRTIDGEINCVCRPGFTRMFPDRPCSPTFSYSVRIPIENSQSSDSNKEEDFQSKLGIAARDALERALLQSELRDSTHGVRFVGFSNTSESVSGGKYVLADFHVQLSSDPGGIRLPTVLLDALMATNFSLGGTEITAVRDVLHELQVKDFDECSSTSYHDCSENAFCFNLHGTYTCSCKTGFEDLSPSQQYPGRMCSELRGCDFCNYRGTCRTRENNRTAQPIGCDCFKWYGGYRCQVNIKVLFLALSVVGVLLLLLAVAWMLAYCWRRLDADNGVQRERGGTRRRRRLVALQAQRGTGFLRYRPPTREHDARAMILDTSSEGSLDNVPVSSHHRHVTVHPVSGKKSHAQPPPPPPGAPSESTSETAAAGCEQRDRSLTVMIPRAKYRAVPTDAHTMSTFVSAPGTDKAALAAATSRQEQKLLSYLDSPDFTIPRGGTNGGNSEDWPVTGELISAGYAVSATVKRGDYSEDIGADAEGDCVERSLKIDQSAPVLQHQQRPLLTSLANVTESEARSFDETTIRPPTRCVHILTDATIRSRSHYGSHHNYDESHTMVERDLGSTFLMPQTHLYQPDRGSDISNFDSL